MRKPLHPKIVAAYRAMAHAMQKSAVPPNRPLPCVHLGDEKGRRPCTGCRGHVELIVYVCRHPAHRETTLDQCRGCPDYQPTVPAG